MAAVDHATCLTVAADGSRVLFLRGDRLWSFEVGAGVARPVARVPEINRYAIDALARVAGFSHAGRLYRVEVATGAVAALDTAGPVTDPRPDPAGGRIGYLAGGGLHVTDGSTDALLAGEPDPAEGGHPAVTWGEPDPAAARHFGLDRGWWWSPDGRGVLATRVDRSRSRPAISLHLLDLDGGWVDVHWDRETYPYLVSVGYADHGDPLIAVLRRPQQHGLVLAVDARTGETQVHAELADPRWVEPIPGTPCHLPDGRVLVGGELAHDGYDARCLFADGTLLTPPSLYVRRVVGRLAGTADILVEGSAGEPSEQHLFRVSTSVGAGGVDTRRITTGAGWHRAVVGGGTVAIGYESLEHAGTRWSVHRGRSRVDDLEQAAGDLLPQPQLARVTDRRLPAGVLYPRSYVAGRKLPVLVEATGLAQGIRAVRADWLARQRWADEGFAVVVVDTRGTPGVAPSFEKAVHRRLPEVALADLADALAALAGKHPDLDLTRVAIRGRGPGGWLAGLATQRHPHLFRCAIAEAPSLDRTERERYLVGAPEQIASTDRLRIVDTPPPVAELAAWLRDRLGG
jgi:dipeptidyl-peptidase-4